LEKTGEQKPAMPRSAGTLVADVGAMAAADVTVRLRGSQKLVPGSSETARE
jgi:hypothetical protein